MLKRIAKFTSLLVCAASIVSIVPVMAEDVKSYDAQEGTIYNAKAKGAGIYIDGEINGAEESTYFVTPDGKYNPLDGVDNGLALDDILLGQYIVFDDEDTVVDIKNNYKVIDENTREDLQDDLDSTARKVLKDDNDDRFKDSEFDSLKTATKYFAIAGTGLSSYKYKLKDPFTIGSTTVKDSDTVYIDYAGNYVDVDYNLGNLKVTTTGGSIYIKNTDDTYDLTEGTGSDKKTYEYRAVINQKSNITDVGDYVYSWADLSIYKKEKDQSDSSYVNVTDQVGFGSNRYNDFVAEDATSIPVLQKFSKPSDSDKTIDGIKYSKDASIYFIADEDGKSEVVLGKDKAASADKVGADTDSNDAVKITGNATAFNSAYYSAKEGKVYAETLKLKSKDGFNYIDLDDTDSTDSDTGIANSGGLIYTLDGGYVKVWDGDSSFKKLYKVDGSMDHLSIGNKDFMMLWNEDDEVYTIINNKLSGTTTTDSTTTTTTPAATVATSAWAKNSDGNWTYTKADGSKATGWFQDNTNNWYYADANGIMFANKWAQSGSTWYYLGASGGMATNQWIQSNGAWYYVGENGAMLANTTTPDGYYVGADGALI